MIWTFLIILWVLFLTMFLVGVLSVRQGTQVLGVRFLPEHRYAPEIKAVVRRFAIGMAAVLVVLAAVSCVLLLPAVRAYGEILMFLLVVADLAGSWLCFSASQKALLRLRKEKGWTPPVRTDVTVDLSVSREKKILAVGDLAREFDDAFGCREFRILDRPVTIYFQTDGVISAVRCLPCPIGAAGLAGLHLAQVTGVMLGDEERIEIEVLVVEPFQMPFGLGVAQATSLLVGEGLPLTQVIPVMDGFQQAIDLAMPPEGVAPDGHAIACVETGRF